MSYDIRKNEDSTLVMPLELPMYEGGTADLGAQALRDLASFLRHQAALETIENNFDLDDPVALELWKSENGQMVAKFVAVLMALTGCADNLDIDIMQEIWEMPWQV